jgi:hypothetical protein
MAELLVIAAGGRIEDEPEMKTLSTSRKARAIEYFASTNQRPAEILPFG